MCQRLRETRLVYATDGYKIYQVIAANPYGDSSFHFDSASVLSDAKKDVEKEIETLKALKEQYVHSGNTSAKSADEGEDDAENAQDSGSEDDSEDDSDRKGMFL